MSMYQKILCYGDSNTYGYDPRSYFGGQYPENVRWTVLLERHGWQVFNRGENGRSIPQRKWDVDAAIQTIKSLRPDIVTIMLGSNDILQDTSLSAEDCALRMERFMQILLEQNCSCKYLLIAPPPMTLGAWVSEKELIKTSKQLGAYYRTATQRLSINFADAGEWNISISFDGVHFSEKGHLTFAKRLHETLAELSGGVV